MAGEPVGDECVGVMRVVGAAPVVGPGRGVVRNDAVCAAGKLVVGAASHNCGLPGVAAAYVGVRCPATACRCCGCPVMPAVTAGVSQGSEGCGGGILGMLGVLAQAFKKGFVGVHRGLEQLRRGGVATAEPSRSGRQGLGCQARRRCGRRCRRWH